MPMDRADRTFSTGFFPWPRLSLKAGDRSRFHFLTNGQDPLFDGGRFHQVDMGDYVRETLCLRSFTEGEEICQLCEDGHDDLANRFACWVYCHQVVHLGGNPDPEAEPWREAKLSGRTVFVEDIKSPLLIWMKAGRQHSWYAQFKAMANKFGSLEGRLYELKRVGSGMSDTDYELSVVEEKPLAKATVKEILEGLTVIEDIFRSTVGRKPRIARLSEEEGLPAAQKESAELPLGSDAETESAGLV